MKQLAGGLKEVKDVKAVTGMLSKTFGGKSDVKDVLGAVTVSSSEVIFFSLVKISKRFWHGKDPLPFSCIWVHGRWRSIARDIMKSN